jgi:hypothetical protein
MHHAPWIVVEMANGTDSISSARYKRIAEQYEKVRQLWLF